MFSQFINPGFSAMACVSMQDLLDERLSNGLTEYLAVSVSNSGQDTCIRFTTTGTQPVTYSTVIPAASCLDVDSLVFVAQPEKG
jgi:hypothetical protein